jgi:hypothetical protein
VACVPVPTVTLLNRLSESVHSLAQITPNQLKEDTVLLSKVIDTETIADLVASAPRDGSTGVRKVSRREKVRAVGVIDFTCLEHVK